MKHFYSVVTLTAAAMAMMMVLGMNAHAAVSITSAAGGTDLSPNKAANGGSPAWTTLGAITVRSSASNDFPKHAYFQTVTFTAPAGWEFRAGTGSASVSGYAIYEDGVSVTASTITVTYSRTNHSSSTAAFSVSGIQVRSKSSAAQSFLGNITKTASTQTIVGFPNGTSVGVLSQAVETLLPVELTDFSATPHNGGMMLTWTTATETNNAGFEIQRRTATSEWQKRGFIDGNGSSNIQHTYTFADGTGYADTYTYRLKQIDRDGAFVYSKEVEAVAPMAAGEYTMDQNYPNPFNPTTTIRFSVPVTQQVTVMVFNMIGQEVASLFNGIAEGGVQHTVQFDAGGLASGTYIYRLRAAERTEVKRMVLVR